MNAARRQEHVENSPSVADFPALGGLGLKDYHLKELSRQGFLATDKRGRRTYVKLRFRCDGRQIVRYVGSAELAQAVSEELAVLQRDHQLQRHLDDLGRAAAQSLRIAKQKVAPLLAAEGFHFHGHAIRKSRPRPI